MGIINDMVQGLAHERRVRASKRSLGFREPSPVFYANRAAFIADWVSRQLPTTMDEDAYTVLGAPVRLEPITGWRIEWQ